MGIGRERDGACTVCTRGIDAEETVHAPSVQRDGEVVVDYPRDKKGAIDFEKIEEPMVYASGLLEEFSAEDAIDIVREFRDNSVSDLQTLDKVKNPIDRKRRKLEIERELDKYDRVLEDLGYSENQIKKT